jgi:hypothetical protein
MSIRVLDSQGVSRGWDDRLGHVERPFLIARGELQFDAQRGLLGLTNGRRLPGGCRGRAPSLFQDFGYSHPRPAETYGALSAKACCRLPATSRPAPPEGFDPPHSRSATRRKSESPGVPRIPDPFAAVDPPRSTDESFRCRISHAMARLMVLLMVVLATACDGDGDGTTGPVGTTGPAITGARTGTADVTSPIPVPDLVGLSASQARSELGRSVSKPGTIRAGSRRTTSGETPSHLLLGPARHRREAGYRSRHSGTDSPPHPVHRHAGHPSTFVRESLGLQLPLLHIHPRYALGVLLVLQVRPVLLLRCRLGHSV